jgi:DNA excision repair protein ERCC-2
MTEMPIDFPFPKMRAAQNEMIDDVRSAVTNGRHLVAHAPTGLGKTIAALYPAVEYAQAEKKHVIFLTSRLSQHKMAIETLQRLGGVTAVDIIGKKWMCSHDVQDSDNTSFSSFCHAMVRDNQCRFYNNFKKNNAIQYPAMQAMAKLRERPMHSGEAKQLAGGQFCTYELLMENAKNSLVVVGDYFHIFSGKTGMFFRRMKKEAGDAIIIVDEAHNLPDRIRSDLSSKISTRTIERAKKESEELELGLERQIEAVGEVIAYVAGKKLKSEQESFLKKEDLIEQISKTYDVHEMIRTFAAAGEKVLEKRRKSSVFRIAVFLERWQGEDFGYARIISRERRDGKDQTSVFYNCLDPSVISKPVIAESHSTIIMSGTLVPQQMYRDVLGMDEQRTDMKAYMSPFPRENRLNIIASGITTRFRERNAANYIKIAKLVANCSMGVRGNAAVFFPSYDIMKNIYALSKSGITKHIIVEQQGMTKDDKHRMQEEFGGHGNAVLFGVLGGSFSEGIDLPGDRLNGVIIVGLPLERPTLSLKALIDYYDSRFKRGNEYGYFYPAMIKVMQAAGRCIRSENDTGVCVFGDERFLWRNYRYIFPRDWDFAISEKPEVLIKNFFAKK